MGDAEGGRVENASSIVLPLNINKFDFVNISEVISDGVTSEVSGGIVQYNGGSRGW